VTNVFQIGFFATRNDLLQLLKELEAKRNIHYAEAGVFDSAKVQAYPASYCIPHLGITDVPNPHGGRIILLADSGTEFLMRAVPQRRGGVRYAVDQRENPDTLSLLPGGQLDDRTVVAGNFGTCTQSHASFRLFHILRQRTQKQWSSIKSYAVGPEAEEVLDAGGRLTAGLRPEYDLRR